LLPPWLAAAGQTLTLLLPLFCLSQELWVDQKMAFSMQDIHTFKAENLEPFSSKSLAHPYKPRLPFVCP